MFRDPSVGFSHEQTTTQKVFSSHSSALRSNSGQSASRTSIFLSPVRISGLLATMVTGSDFYCSEFPCVRQTSANSSSFRIRRPYQGLRFRRTLRSITPELTGKDCRDRRFEMSGDTDDRGMKVMPDLIRPSHTHKFNKLIDRLPPMPPSLARLMGGVIGAECRLRGAVATRSRQVSSGLVFDEDWIAAICYMNPPRKARSRHLHSSIKYFTFPNVMV